MSNLVLLQKEILDEVYQSSNEEDEDFHGAAMMNIYNPQGQVLLTILELTDGRIAFLFDDNTWIDSTGNTGFIPRPVNRTLNSFSKRFAGESQQPYCRQC